MALHNSTPFKSASDALSALEELYTTPHYISYSELAALRQPTHSTAERLKDFYKNPTQYLRDRPARKKARLLSQESTRHSHNDHIIAQAQRQPRIIEGSALDPQQIEAVVANEDTQIVMAAAGSGKTLSLLAKCDYLVHSIGIDPTRILTISFTKASADELSARLAKMGLNVDGKTFHALGKAIVGNELNVVDQSGQQAILSTILNNKIKNDQQFARRYNDYMLHYFTVPTLPIDAASLEALVQSNRTFQSVTLKPVSLDKHRYSTDDPTLHGEHVRSKEEQIIANFLYINNIAYEYEKPFPGYAGYNPDFTITSYGEPIYLEHQGINRHGKTRYDIDAKYYRQKMAWQKNYHAQRNTRLIETYSYEFQEGTILRNLEAKLKAEGVEVIRRQESEIAMLIKNSYSSEVVSFNNLLVTFLGLLKTSELSLSGVRHRARAIKSNYERRRTGAFLALFEELYEEYEAALQQRHAIDFSDMIVQAADKLPLLADTLAVYDYILVDEIQDLSGARYRLLKALLDRNPRSKLFAVGDDWQAIFRFAGSDLTLIRDFETKFQRYTRHGVIEQTHRFSNPLLDITSDFIKKNPLQIQKRPFSKLSTRSSLTVNNSATLDNDASALDEELQKLINREGMEAITGRSIFLIGRYKRDVQRLLSYEDPRLEFRALDEARQTIEWTNTRTNHTLVLKFMTMHASKGLTCDHAFILNGNAGAMGIPAERENDPVIQLLLAHEENYPHAEERRLFYVAMTRAKRSTTIITTTHRPSPFVQELAISQQEADVMQKHCPVCHSGYLIKRTGGYGDFYGCSNYGYGCSYTTRRLDTL